MNNLYHQLVNKTRKEWNEYCDNCLHNKIPFDADFQQIFTENFIEEILKLVGNAENSEHFPNTKDDIFTKIQVTIVKHFGYTGRKVSK